MELARATEPGIRAVREGMGLIKPMPEKLLMKANEVQCYCPDWTCPFAGRPRPEVLITFRELWIGRDR